MAHDRVSAAENILDKEYKVLNKGFVRLVDYLGGDSRIVQAARVSYGKGTKSKRQDEGLINYLMRNEHTSPFEQVIMTFHCKMPIFVARQWVRHRTARLNEISGRYSVMENEFYVPDQEQIRYQSKDNKQGRNESDEVPQELQQKVLDIIKSGQRQAYDQYNKMLDENIARELARINLPLSLYTQWYWQIDLHNLFHFLKLRMDPHAQWEIRQYAKVMASMAEKVAPFAFEAFETHMLNAVNFSGIEARALAKVLAGEEYSLNPTAEADFKRKLNKIKKLI
ncbi:MAG: FAD-dependent thymidylate synthase [Candidatus Marinimicrobia bacterium]|nr:FAD-dependent thymidylate synthase [Candidatus Neomarinimicrobiota bacterium]